MEIRSHTSSIALGFDPDTHYSAWALCSEDSLFACGMFKTTMKHKGARAVADQINAILQDQSVANSVMVIAPSTIICEGQHNKVRTRTGVKIPAEGLFHLSQISGAFGLYAKGLVPDAKLYFPPPSGKGSWKGSVPKNIHQARILSRYDLSLAHLAEMAGVTQHQANHVIDAMGLARFGAQGLKLQT